MFHTHGHAQHALPTGTPGQSRVWTNQTGSSITAKLVEKRGANVVLELANGTRSTVPIEKLSKPDQFFIQQLNKADSTGNTPAAAPVSTFPAGPLVWPSAVAIDPKAVAITVGEQNATQRKFHYQSGSFRFVANTALNGTVMKEVAADFELTRAFIAQLPWGWQPKPKEGDHFLIYLTETLNDFIALGGNDQSAAGSTDDYIYIKFSAMGLKQVGPRYAYDAKQKVEGEVIGMTTRLLCGEMRNLAYPWARMGLEELAQKLAYHKGSLRFDNLGSALKSHIQEQAKIGVNLDLDRLIDFLHVPSKDLRSNVKQIRRENYFDGLLLVYFFGFLDGDGKGTALHKYYQSIAHESLGWRAFLETKNEDLRPRPRDLPGGYPEWSLEYMTALLRGRNDEQLKAEIAAKYSALNIRFGK